MASILTSFAAGPAPERFPAGTVRLDFRHAGNADFALALPPAVPLPEALRDRGPLWVVVLHGHGSQGDQLFTRPDVRDLWLPAIRSRGFGILTPNIGGNSWMNDAAAQALHALLDELRRRYGVRRFLLAGGSMGGTAALIYAVRYPQDLLGCVALCPATDLPSYRDFAATGGAPVLREIATAIDLAYAGDRARMQAHSALHRCERLPLPLFLAHGSADATIPVEQSRRLEQALHQQAGCRYRELPGGNHDAPLGCLPEGLDWVCARLLREDG